MKKTWIMPNKAFESFGSVFLGCSDVLKLYLHRLPAKAAKVCGLHFRKKSVYRGETLERQKHILQFKTNKGE